MNNDYLIVCSDSIQSNVLYHRFNNSNFEGELCIKSEILTYQFCLLFVNKWQSVCIIFWMRSLAMFTLVIVVKYFIAQSTRYFIALVWHLRVRGDVKYLNEGSPNALLIMNYECQYVHTYLASFIKTSTVDSSKIVPKSLNVEFF